MEAAWQIMQIEVPDDYVIATGKAHSGREFAEEAFRQVGLEPDSYVVSDARFLRPSQAGVLIGDSTRARTRFGFDPKFKFAELVGLMVDANLERQRQAPS